MRSRGHHRALVRCDQRRELVVAQRARGLLRRVENVPAQLIVARIVPMRLEPGAHVRDPRHVPNVDALREPEIAGRNAGVNPIRQPRVALLLRLRNRRCVHARRRPKRILAHHRIARRNRNAERARCERGVLAESVQIVVMRAKQPEIDEQQIHLGVAHALTDAERGAVHAIDSGFDGREAVRKAIAAIAMPMPVDLHFLAGRRDDLLAYEAHERAYAIGGLENLSSASGSISSAQK